MRHLVKVFADEPLNVNSELLLSIHGLILCGLKKSGPARGIQWGSRQALTARRGGGITKALLQALSILLV